VRPYNPPVSPDPLRARRQIALLVCCQALLYINSVTLITVNGLAGLVLAPSPILATLPVTSYIVGAASMTMPASLAMGRFGRRAGFLAGGACAITGALLAALAVHIGSFALLCAGTLVMGVYNAFGQYLRFAAADVAEAYDPSLKERAISWVLAGGIAGGILGPELSKLTRDVLPVLHSGAYAALAAAALGAMLVASRLQIPTHKASTGGAARPLREVAAQPTFIVAVLVGAISFGAMNLLMTATPLAMKVCGFGYPESADVIKWHVVAMFAPGFFTGSLVRRFGPPRVILVGCILMAATIGVAHSGISYLHFWAALVTLGLGWNFMFTSATTLLTGTYRPTEKAKVQGTNDLAIFLTMMTSSAASGALVSTTGWQDLNFYAAPFVLIAAMATGWLVVSQRRTAIV
jgi:predicted MFS family arabinose efflux permease